MPDRVTILSPTGHLGFTPIEADSFRRGLEERPDFIVADSGSCDIGPHPLGADEACSPAAWQRHDLELMLLAGRRLGIPMMRRDRPSGSPGERDVFGSQQDPPLFALPVPLP